MLIPEETTITEDETSPTVKVKSAVVSYDGEWVIWYRFRSVALNFHSREIISFFFSVPDINNYEVTQSSCFIFQEAVFIHNNWGIDRDHWIPAFEVSKDLKKLQQLMVLLVDTSTLRTKRAESLEWI